MKRFSYVASNTLDEAVSVLEPHDAVIVAGGTDILNVLKARSRPEAPRALVDIGGIPGLDRIEEDEAGLKIGALVRLSQIEDSGVVSSRFALLRQAAHAVASPQIRNMGTLGGNLCQEPRCWYYRYPENVFHCLRKGGRNCPALTGQNRFHSVFGAARVADPPCRSACPGHIDIPGFLARVRAGALDEAAALLLENNPIPAITGRVCPHFCQRECNRGDFDDSVSIRNVERFIGDYVLDHAERFFQAPRSETGRHVAIVGSGPAGLAAACYLRRAGHRVTVYDGRRKAGGMLHGAPEYRLPEAVLDRVIAALQRTGIEFVLGREVGRDLPLEAIRRDCDCVLLASGLWAQRLIGIPGEALTSFGIAFLTEGLESAARVRGKRVMVIGGGNVAMDVAVTAARLGAREVAIACLERREEMPAYSEEIEQALEEGVAILNSWGPAAVAEDPSGERSVELVRCVSVFDEQGRFRPGFDRSVKIQREVDEIFLAVGQKAEFSYLGAGLELGTARGTIEVRRETQHTGVSGLYAAGDVTSGPASAIEAIAAGRRAATAIDRELGGRGAHGAGAPAGAQAALVKFDAASLRQSAPAVPRQLPASERSVDREDVHSLAAEAARAESSRCFNCGCVATSPSDLAPALIALGASIRTTARTVPAEQFFKAGPMSSTILEPGEILTGVEIPRLPEGSGQAFLKVSARGAIDFPIVSVACVLAMEDGKVREARIALGGVAPVPWRSRAAEAALAGRPVTEENAARAGLAAVAGAIPLSDNSHVTRMISTLVKRAVLESR